MFYDFIWAVIYCILIRVGALQELFPLHKHRKCEFNIMIPFYTLKTKSWKSCITCLKPNWLKVEEMSFVSKISFRTLSWFAHSSSSLKNCREGRNKIHNVSKYMKWKICVRIDDNKLDRSTGDALQFYCVHDIRKIW